MMKYAELQATSNFSFLRGGSHPEELVERAAELGYTKIAITDRNSVAGVVRAHQAAKLLYVYPAAPLPSMRPQLEYGGIRTLENVHPSQRHRR